MNLFKNIRMVGFWACPRGSIMFSSSRPSPDPAPKTRAKRKSSYISTGDQIRHHLRDSPTYMANCERLNPDLFRNRCLPPVSWYCLADETAEMMFDAMKSHLSPGRTIFEMNPGLGLLTKKLLSTAPARLYAFEPDPSFREILSPLSSNHPEFTVVPKHFLSIWKEDFKEKLYGGERLSKLLPFIECSDWYSGPTIQIIGAVPSQKFLVYILSCLIYESGITSYGRPEILFVTTPDILVKISYRNSSMYDSSDSRKFSKLLLFIVFFDIEMLGEVDGKCFLPRFRKRKPKKKSTKTYNADERLVFVRAVAKKDIHAVVPPNLLKPLWFFVNQAVLLSRYQVIPYLEKWIPGCGPLFIVKGLSVFTEFRELSTSQLLDVFFSFVHHPDYISSLFDAAVQSFVFNQESDACGEFTGDDAQQVDEVVIEKSVLGDSAKAT